VCVGQVKTTNVRYSYEFHVHRADPKVTEVIETIIHRSLRKEGAGPLFPEAPKQVEFAVESWRVAEAMQDLNRFLGFNSSSYSIYILNPKRPNHKDGALFW